MSRIPTTPQGDDYIKRHGLDGLFNDLMNRLLQDRPMEPISYLIKTLTDITEKCKNPMPVVHMADCATPYNGDQDFTSNVKTEGVIVIEPQHNNMEEMPRSAVSPEVIRNVLSTYATGIGVPIQFIFYPLLTAVAAMMRSHTQLRLAPLWTEPAILWTIVTTGRGEKKTAAMKIIADAVKEVEEHIRQEQNNVHVVYTDGNESHHPSLHMTNMQFTYSSFRKQMGENYNQCLLLHDDISSLYEQLEHKTDSQQCDRKKLYSLYGGEPWLTDENKRSSTPNTHFNYTGFLHPNKAKSLLKMENSEGFSDCHAAIIFPQPIKFYFNHLQVQSETLMTLGQVLVSIYNVHNEEREYYLSDGAKQGFADFYDRLEDLKEQTIGNEECQCVLTKAQGQLARVAMVIHCLYTSIESLSIGLVTCDIPLQIPVHTMQYAVHIMEHCLHEKFSVMPQCELLASHFEVPMVTETTVHYKEPSPPAPSPPDVDMRLSNISDDPYNYTDVIKRYPYNVKSLLEYGRDDLAPSFVAQRKLMPSVKKPLLPTPPGKTHNRYPTEAARHYLHRLSNLGLGTIDMPEPDRRPTLFTFRKRKYEDLSPRAKRILTELKVTEESYKRQRVCEEVRRPNVNICT